MGFVLQDQLFEEEQRSLVVHALTHLHLRGPRVRSPSLFALIALLVLHSKINAECLLEHRVVLYLLLNSKL